MNADGRGEIVETGRQEAPIRETARMAYVTLPSGFTKGVRKFKRRVTGHTHQMAPNTRYSEIYTRDPLKKYVIELEH